MRHNWVFENWWAWVEQMLVEHQMSQYEWSKRIDCDGSYLSKMRRTHSLPSRDVACRLAEEVNLPREVGLIKAGYLPDPHSAELLELVLARQPYKPTHSQPANPGWYRLTDGEMMLRLVGRTRKFGTFMASELRFLGRSPKGMLFRVPGKPSEGLEPSVWFWDPISNSREMLFHHPGVISRWRAARLVEQYL